MSNETTNQTEIKEDHNNDEVLNKELSLLQQDLDAVGEDLDKENISLEEYQVQANDVLMKHTFVDFMKYYTAAHDKNKLLSNANEEDIANDKVFISANGVSAKERRKRYKKEVIAARAEIRACKLFIDAYEFEEACKLYKEKNLIQYRNDEEYLKKAIENISKVYEHNFKTEYFNLAKYAEKDIIDTIGNHLIIVANEIVKVHGQYDGRNFVRSLAKNCNVVSIVMGHVRKYGVEATQKAELTAYETFCNGIKKFSDLIFSEIDRTGA